MSAFTNIRWQLIRKGLFLTTLLGVLFVSYRVGQEFAEWREPHTAVPVNSAAGALNPLAGALIDGGQWSFANLAWNIRSRILPAADVESRISSIVSAPASTDPSQLPDASPELLRLITSTHLVPTEQAGAQIYRLDRPSLKAVLVLRKIDDRTKAAFGVVAYPQNDQEWQEFEFTPSSTPAANGVRMTHLLPLPQGAIQSGARFADDGHPLLEMITTHTTADSLLTDWKNAGWDVHPSGLGSETGFSYLCARGDDVVYAWSADPSHSLQHLMLVHTPTDVETKRPRTSPTN